YALGFRVNHQRRQTVGAVEAQRATGSRPGKLRNSHLDAFLFRLGLGQAAPRHFGVSEHHSRDDKRVATARFPGDDFDGDAPLAGRLVREQHAARAVADGVDGWVVGLLLFVDLDETLFVALNPRALQTEVVTIGNTADRHQHAVEQFFVLLSVRL